MLTFLKDHSQYLLLILGLVIGTAIIWLRKEKIGQKKLWQAVVTGIFFTLCSFGSAILFADFEGLLTGASIKGMAVSTYGVYFFAALMIWGAATFLKLNVAAYMDTFALYAIPSLFLMRCNCMLSGCCLGKYIPGTEMRWLTRETELLFFIVLFLLLLRMEKRQDVPGQLFPVMMMAYGGFRFLNQWFRVGDAITLGLHLSHIWSILCLGIGGCIWFELKLRAERKAAHENRHRRK